MTSGKFTYLPVDSIIVDRENRQRRELTGIEELAKSIADNGLINPIVVTQDGVLIAGERRLSAHKHLGFDSIAVQYAEDLDEIQLHLIELEENVRREDLTWQDHANAVARYHELQAKMDPEWSQDDTAEALNMSRSNVTRHLMVNKAIEEGIPEVLAAPKMSVAANFVQRKNERQKTTILRDLRQTSQEPTITEADIPSDRFADIVLGDFKRWSRELQEQPFNLIHCDFPYGVNAGDTKGQSGALGFGQYEDKPEIFFDLLDTLLKNQDNFISPSAHMMFWFSMDFYEITREKIRAAGWRVDPFPLVWYKSDNTGILPDPQRGPRRIYETALFCTRGDRKVVKAVGNVAASGVSKKFHVSEKAPAMLEHFFRMLVDETTVMLDPTCGSGNAVKIAEKMGANWSLGLEKNPEFVEAARQNLEL